MIETTADEVKEAFASAKNLNAALKSFLKKESASANGVEAFAKEFRNAATRGPAGTSSYIEKNFPRRENYFLALVRYTHPEIVQETSEKIIDEYADRFNATYTRKEQGIEVTDKKEFDSIVKNAAGKIESGLKAAGLPASNFMKKALMVCIFEPDVFVEAVEAIR